MKGGVILFIVEGISDETAITVFITEELKKQKIKTTVKVTRGDILTKYINYTRKFEINSNNVKGEIQKIILEYINKIKSQYIKLNDINKIYYVTDTDNCFFENKSHSINKKECLIKMFNFVEIEIKKSKIPFEIIFFSYNLEHVIADNSNSLTDKEKEEISNEFATKALNNREYFINTFKNNNLKTWSNFRESYNGIQNFNGKACNVNNLLDEIESWK